MMFMIEDRKVNVQLEVRREDAAIAANGEASPTRPVEVKLERTKPNDRGKIEQWAGTLDELITFALLGLQAAALHERISGVVKAGQP